MKNAVYWVEIPAKNFDRAKAFYETVFGIEINLVPFPIGKCGILPFDMKGPGGGAAIIEGEGYEPAGKGAIIYIDIEEDLDTSLSKVEGAGGKIIFPKTANKGFGFIAQFIDSEGNRMGLHSNS